MLTKATRASRPLIEYPIYFERDFCSDCMKNHMVEKTRSGKVICHGEGYYFKSLTAHTHYSRRLGNGFELVPITSPKQVPLEWQIAAEAKEPEYVDVDQDW